MISALSARCSELPRVQRCHHASAIPGVLNSGPPPFLR
ncbi:hypothetical protein BN2537_8667 [Streptomyces venezuelae]|nr:hypothetical protein BN2537_8667 [Streptomyces venezuelae]